MTHKSRIWRDIDKHPLPARNCKIDVKLSCGSVLINCERIFSEKNMVGFGVFFRGFRIGIPDITQWRDAK